MTSPIDPNAHLPPAKQRAKIAEAFLRLHMYTKGNGEKVDFESYVKAELESDQSSAACPFPQEQGQKLLQLLQDALAEKPINIDRPALVEHMKMLEYLAGIWEEDMNRHAKWAGRADEFEMGIIDTEQKKLVESWQLGENPIEFEQRMREALNQRLSQGTDECEEQYIQLLRTQEMLKKLAATFDINLDSDTQPGRAAGQS